MTFLKRQAKAIPAKAGKASEGNTAAAAETDFEALFQQNWTRVCTLLFRLVGDQAEAEDLALEAFLRLYQRPPGSSHNLGGWLYRVATNLGFNALRARKRRQRYEEEAGFLVLEHGTAWDPALVIEQAQEREQVRAALADMQPRSAQLLVLRHSGHSYADIAEALGVAPASVGTLLARAEKEFLRHYPGRDEG